MYKMIIVNMSYQDSNRQPHCRLTRSWPASFKCCKKLV